MLFRSVYVREPANQVSEDGRRKRQEELTKEAGVAWRKLSQAERDSYQASARHGVKEHMAKYPQYWSSRRAKNGRYARADTEHALGSPVNTPRPEHEAMLGADPRSSVFSAPSPPWGAASPQPFPRSSSSSEKCLTPSDSSLPIHSPFPVYPSGYLAGQGGFLNGSQLTTAPVSVPIHPSWYPPPSSVEPSASASSYPASLSPRFCVTEEDLAPKSQIQISYQDWAFVDGEDLIDPNVLTFRDNALYADH